MRFQNKKVSARATALALVLGVVGVLVTALPASAATVTSFTPSCAAIGATVTVNGSGFTAGAAASSVTFPGGVAGTILAGATDTVLTVNVPATSTGAAPLVVVDADGNGTSATNFVVGAAAQPTITSFTPLSGAVGSSVVITGTNFGCTSLVQFNAASATFVVNSTTQITATVPAGATTGQIHVTVPTFTVANSPLSFTVAAAPTITSFTPITGPVGTSVVITGTNLTGVTAVRFNGLAATFSANTATSVTAVVPTGATTGKVSLTTPGGIATSTADFTVTTAPLARSVNFGFDPHSRVSGQVNVTNGTTACRSLVPVIIQKQKGSSWKWVDTTATRKTGSFKTYIPPSNGNFRAKVNQITLANGVVCARSTSNVVHS